MLSTIVSMLNYVINIEQIVFLEKGIEMIIVIMKGMYKYENYKTKY